MPVPSIIFISMRILGRESKKIQKNASTFIHQGSEEKGTESSKKKSPCVQEKNEKCRKRRMEAFVIEIRAVASQLEALFVVRHFSDDCRWQCNSCTYSSPLSIHT